MSIFSKILNKIKPSASNIASQNARKLKELTGKNIIALSSGEPDFDTPPHIKYAAIKALAEGKTKYTPIVGILKLREKISQKLYKDNNLEYDINQIIVSNGAKQVIFNALLAIINKGDEVIIPSPYWASYPEMVTLCGGNPIIIPTDLSSNFKITADNLEKAITKKTKCFIFNSPNNPSGAVYNYKELLSLTNVLLKNKNIWVIEDDIYEKIIYDNIKFYTLPQIQKKLYNRTLIVNGLSKSHSMTGWRIGYGAGPSKLIQFMATIQSQTTSGASSISQWAAIAAFNEKNNYINKWLKKFINRRDFVVNEINQINGLFCTVPQGAFYIYPSCYGLLNKCTYDKKIIKNDEDFVNLLLSNEGIAVVNGTSFGMSMHFRISYAASMQDLQEACKRIKKFCYSLT